MTLPNRVEVMKLQSGLLELVVICAVVVLLSMGGLIWAFAAGLAFSMDGLLLISICLMMGGIFSLMLLWIAKDAGWLARFPIPGKKSAGGPGAPPTATAL